MDILESGSRIRCKTIAGNDQVSPLWELRDADVREAGLAAIFEKDDAAGNVDGGPIWFDPNEPMEAITGEQHRCEEGEVSGFSCDNVDLLAFLPIICARRRTHREDRKRPLGVDRPNQWQGIRPDRPHFRSLDRGHLDPHHARIHRPRAGQPDLGS